ncbi:MAG: energy transducer TonB [bacterium]
MRRMRPGSAGWALPVGLSLLVNFFLLAFIGTLFKPASPQMSVFEVTRFQTCTLIVTPDNPVNVGQVEKTSPKNAPPPGCVKPVSSGKNTYSSPLAGHTTKYVASRVAPGKPAVGNEKFQEGSGLSGKKDGPVSALVEGGGGGEPAGGVAGGRMTPGEGIDNAGAGTSGESVRPDGETREACVLFKTPPPYPPEAREEGVEGTTVLEIILSTSGRIKQVATCASSGDPRLDRAAEKSVRLWRFSPRLREGAPQEASLRIQVSFRLE